MSDVYADIAAADPQTLEALINGMEVRAADPRQCAIRESLFAAAALPTRSRVLEVGCGSGAICRDLARRPEVAAVTGVDPVACLPRQGTRAGQRVPQRGLR